MDLEPQALADRLGVSRAAVELYLDSQVVDLHIDTFIWQRLFGYDLTKQHGTGPLGARFFGQADLPRVLEAGLAGALWIVTTNPLRGRLGKRDAALANIARLRALLDQSPRAAVVAGLAEYRAARAAGKHAAFIGIQGGNALEFELEDFDRPELAQLSLITLLHFTRSRIGAPALPRALAWGDQRLTAFGRDYVRKLNQRRILVDLAHLSRDGFWDALEIHDKTLPPTVSHAGCDAVYPHFRNLTDPQLKAIADHGGVIGIMFQAQFLGPSTWAGKIEWVADHILHAVRVVGAEHVALGSDFDGAIVPPPALSTVLHLPRLVDLLLSRGLPEPAVRQILGLSFLQMLERIRP
ncbi:MAG: membrane dipeptidase [Myxococcales bacterium]